VVPEHCSDHEPAPLGRPTHLPYEEDFSEEEEMLEDIMDDTMETGSGNMMAGEQNVSILQWNALTSSRLFTIQIMSIIHPCL
jgi:hypothetical protein